MNKKNILVAAGVAAILGCLQMAVGEPVVNIGNRHGELRAAQEAIVSAWEHTSQAQFNNHDELGGHAAKAKEYLEKADEELRRAADFANGNR